MARGIFIGQMRVLVLLENIKMENEMEMELNMKKMELNIMVNFGITNEMVMVKSKEEMMCFLKVAG